MFATLIAFLRHNNDVHPIPSRVDTLEFSEACARDKQIMLLKNKTFRLFPS